MKTEVLKMNNLISEFSEYWLFTIAVLFLIVAQLPISPSMSDNCLVLCMLCMIFGSINAIICKIILG